MARVIFVYGVIAGAIIMASLVLGLWLGAGGGGLGEWTGYLIMLAAFSLIFIGIKRYRDTEMGGVIRFVTALGVGLGIAMVASIIYVAGWELYLWLTHYAFFDAYSKELIAAKRAHGASAAEIAKLTSDLAEMGMHYAQPLYRMVMTLFEILPVGVVVALVSAALLRNSNFLSVRGARATGG